MDNNNDVDLDSLLSEPQTDSSAGASSGTEQEGSSAGEGVKAQEQGSKSQRENERVRELADKVGALETFIRDNLNKPQNQGKSEVDPADLDSFLESAVADKGSRDVLRKMAGMIEQKLEKKYSPDLGRVRDIEFENEFSQLASKIPSLTAHKAEVLKSYQNNPGKSLKEIAGAIVLDIAANRVKPVESQRSQVSREKPDLDSMSKDELYEQLNSMRE